MSDENGTDTYTVSFKTSGGYDASLIVARGNTAAELVTSINALLEPVDEGPDQPTLLDLVVDTENLLHAAHSLKTPAASVTPINGQASAAPAAAEVVMMCPHGKRSRREGRGAKGAWVGYFCPLEKGSPNQCKPEWEDNK